MFSLGFVSALPFTPWNHVYNTLLCNCTCIITFFRLRPFHVSCIVSRHRIKLTVNHLSACEVVTSPFCGLLRHCFYNLHHWLTSWYLKIFDDFSVVSWLLSFWVFVKEQSVYSVLLLEISDSVSALITGFDFLALPVVCLVVVSPDPSFPPLPRLAPRLQLTHPSPRPRPPTCSGHSSAVVHSRCPLSRVCALSSCLITWCFSPTAVTLISITLCRYKHNVDGS